MQPDIRPVPYEFVFEEQSVRVTLDKDGNHLFFGADLCKVLGYLNPSRAISAHVDDEDKRYTTYLNGGIGPITNSYTPDGNQILLINESGMYALIMGSTKPGAKRFKRWVTSEVLPALRKTGNYTLKTMSQAEQLLMSAQILVQHEREINGLKEGQEELREGQQQIDQRVSTLETVTRTNQEFVAVRGYCNLHKIRLSDTESALVGKKATKLSKERGVPIFKMPDGKFGEVGQYHVDILDEVIRDLRAPFNSD